MGWTTVLTVPWALTVVALPKVNVNVNVNYTLNIPLNSYKTVEKKGPPTHASHTLTSSSGYKFMLGYGIQLNLKLDK